MCYLILWGVFVRKSIIFHKVWKRKSGLQYFPHSPSFICFSLLLTQHPPHPHPHPFQSSIGHIRACWGPGGICSHSGNLQPLAAVIRVKSSAVAPRVCRSARNASASSDLRRTHTHTHLNTWRAGVTSVGNSSWQTRNTNEAAVSHKFNLDVDQNKQGVQKREKPFWRVFWMTWRKRSHTGVTTQNTSAAGKLLGTFVFCSSVHFIFVGFVPMIVIKSWFRH